MFFYITNYALYILAGIELTLNLAQNEYVASIGAKAGAVVVIHQHATMPFPEDEGVFAPPGMLTSIATKRVRTHCCLYIDRNK